jgi:hypothetical protein
MRVRLFGVVTAQGVEAARRVEARRGGGSPWLGVLDAIVTGILEETEGANIEGR